MLKKLTLTMLICFLSISLVNSQTIEIKPYGVSARTVEADTNDIFDLKYNGLANVGVGTKIYLAGMAVDTTFNSPSWSITAQPAGSTVSILANEDLN
ncbi:MAG: hypothetical protein KDC90_20410, partial [Ignavibacteriae bacterium]|nr:hypothetical protein [Ignavibacteriota bacterium]